MRISIPGYSDKVGTNDTAIQFIKNIPWVIDQPVDLIVNSKAIGWQESFDLRSSRKLYTENGGASFHAESNLNGSWLSLTVPVAAKSRSRRGNLLVIDTAHGTVRQWDGIDPRRLQDIQGEPAHLLFNRVYQRYHRLEQTPYEPAIFEPIDLAEHGQGDITQNVIHTTAYWYLKVAANESGWPNANFSGSTSATKLLAISASSPESIQLSAGFE